MKTLLFHCPQMEPLARLVHGAIAGGDLSVVQWKEFPDGFPNLFIEDAEYVRGNDAVFLASFDTTADIFRQLSVIYALPRYGARSLRVILPYFPTGTMDRVAKKGEVVTAMTLARMLSAIPHCRGTGPAEIVIYDIHALQEQFFFSDNVVPRLETAIPLIIERIRRIPNVAVAFPDDGARKRFGHLFADFPQIICEKIRREQERIVRVKEGDPRGRSVVIVDDLGMTGGTQVACRHALVAAGAAQVSTYATHGVHPNGSWQQFTPDLFDRVFITDSCPNTARDVADEKHIEVLSLAPLIAHVIRS